MITIEDALVTLLNSNSALTAVIGTASVYPAPAGQNTPYPFVDYYTQSEFEVQGLGGSHGMVNARITFKAWSSVSSVTGDQIADCATVAELVRLALVGYKGTVDGIEIDCIFKAGKQDGYDTDAKANWRAIDFEVWHKVPIPTF